jgi:peptide/nickel transport system substrate-binding protein
VRTLYVKNTDYVPREEPASWFAGGKVVKVDRVEWVAMPDPNTTMNAIISGEIDFVESMPHDLLPIVKQAPGVKAEVHNTLGMISMLRMNFLHPPLNDKKVRQAILHAVSQEDYMKAQVGDPQYYKLCTAIFMCGTPLETTAGSEPLVKKDLNKARQLLKEAGYDGAPVYVMHTPDQPTLSPYGPVTSQALKAIGMNVETVALDWQTLLSRRARQDPPAQGGWGIFHTTWVSADMLNPVMQGGLNARGPKNGGWFGWVDDPEMERLRDEFARTSDPAKQKELAETIQKRAYDEVYYIIGGMFYQVAVSRDWTTNWIKAPASVFWNVEKKKT